MVTGGGRTSDGPWKAVRNGFLLPARVVMAVFRGKLLAAIRQAFARGALGLPEPMRPQQFINLVNRLGHPTKTRWSVRIMERYRHGAGVVTYVARYLRGGPIKNAAMQSGRPSISIHGMFASPSGATAIGTATAPPAAGHAVPAARANPAEAPRHQSILTTLPLSV